MGHPVLSCFVVFWCSLPKTNMVVGRQAFPFGKVHVLGAMSVRFGEGTILGHPARFVGNERC